MFINESPELYNILEPIKLEGNIKIHSWSQSGLKFSETSYITLICLYDKQRSEYQITDSQSLMPRATAGAASENLLEIQIFWPHPRPTEVETLEVRPAFWVLMSPHAPLPPPSPTTTPSGDPESHWIRFSYPISGVSHQRPTCCELDLECLGATFQRTIL